MFEYRIKRFHEKMKAANLLFKEEKKQLSKTCRKELTLIKAKFSTL